MANRRGGCAEATYANRPPALSHKLRGLVKQEPLLEDPYPAPAIEPRPIEL